MKKKILCLLTAMAVAAAGAALPVGADEAAAPRYQSTARQMERLNRGLIAVRTADAPRNGIAAGVYLSWRLLGDESLENQAFDIYRNGVKIHTTGPHDATSFTDAAGTENDAYKVLKAGAGAAEALAEPETHPFTEWNHTARGSLVGNGSEANSFSWVDIPLVRPADVINHGGGTGVYYGDGCGPNDASVGDLDGDGDYELVLKWDPSDSKDSASGGYTSNVYIDAYEISPENGGYMWRIDLGKNIRAGAHYTQFMVYDLDGDGKSEVAMKTAPGSKDALGNYVNGVMDRPLDGNLDDNEKVYLSGKGVPISGGEYLTVFSGETGEALYTTDYISRDAGDWGDSKFNRSERYLAAVAYLNGETPSLIMCRGYYNRAMVRAYDWDGAELKLIWEHNGDAKRADSLYGQGNHNLSVADVDNDGKDEIVYGSAVLDNNGKAIGNTFMGHGDAMHVSDFNNDGVQEVFSVKEDSGGYSRSEDFRVAATGEAIYSKKYNADNGRGLMVNADDSYAAAHPEALSVGWSASGGEAHDLTGAAVGAKPATNSRMMTNFAVYWDGDLGRELLDDNQLAKYHADGGWTGRFYNDGQGYLPATSNNSSKQTPCLSADLWGDWREEIIMRVGNGRDETPCLRIFTSTLPTKYRLTTLMHDCQYRLGVAWQNVAYNQPPHTSYYIGTASLAKDASGAKLNYPAPATAFTKVRYPERVSADGINLSRSSVTIKQGASVRLRAEVSPENATTKTVIWTSDDEGVATVSGGTVTAVGVGECTVTATAADGGFSAECRVSVLPIYTVDVLDYGSFAGSEGEGISFAGDRTSARLTQESSADGAEFSRGFIPFGEDTVRLGFDFNTGGRKDADGAWNWDGREYTFGLDFLDAQGRSLLLISQSYRSGAQSTSATVGGMAEAIKTSWTQIGDGAENPMDRSSTTWHVTLIFDYDAQALTATVMGSNNDIGYTKTFGLEGNFKRLRCFTTVDGSGPISVSPSLSGLSYELITAENGAKADVLSLDEAEAEARLIGSGDAVLIGALYDAKGNLAEAVGSRVKLPTVERLSFGKNAKEHELRLFLWSSASEMTPLSRPYTLRPESKLAVASVEATAEPEPENPAKNACDGDTNTFWSAENTQSITFDLGEERLVGRLRVAFKKYDDNRTIPFRIYTSSDGVVWHWAYSGTSKAFSGDFIDISLSPVPSAAYVKIECDGHSISHWTSLSEVEIYGY